MVGNFSASRKFGLRRSLSRISTRVSTEAASILASSDVLEGSAGSYLAEPLTLVNAPRIVETPTGITENCAEECIGSICQVAACAAAVAAKSEHTSTDNTKRDMFAGSPW